MLSEAQYEEMERIATYCAHHKRGYTANLTIAERWEAALDGVVAEVAENGWPDGAHSPLFRAAWNAIHREDHQRGKHLSRWWYWTPPRNGGIADPVGDRVADRIGIQQAVWVLDEHEWLAIWSLAQAMSRDLGITEAAAMAGMSRASFFHRIHNARVKIRPLWIPPDEHPRGMYQPSPRGHRGRLSHWQDGRKKRTADRLARYEREERETA